MSVVISKNEKQTEALGLKFAKSLQGGEVLLLTGDLGAGKTVFVRGLARGLGINRRINSPTFVLMKLYEVSEKNSMIKHLAHLDAYRVSGEDLINIGLEEYLNRHDSVVVIEWGEKIAKLLKQKKYRVQNIEFKVKKDLREIKY